ncbi:MAG: DUF4920 domain-containing protein [Bryobacteraceae bacterium]|nr:DUF4920 domain-containing protein [Bryobacteraceae bacterium]
MKLWLVALLSLAAFAAGSSKRLGAPFTVAEVTPVERIAEQPDKYVGKVVRVEGKVTEVCQMMGCWMNLVDPSGKQSLRIKVNDGEIVFPKEAVGKIAQAEGKLVKLELTKEQAAARAKHEAEEQGRAFNPDSVKGPVTVYQIQGAAAEIPGLE